MSKVRIGSPGWEEAAKDGRQLTFSMHVHFDEECQRYWGESPDLDGLIVEAGSVEEFHQEAKLGAEDLLEHLLGMQPVAEVTFLHSFQQVQALEYA